MSALLSFALALGGQPPGSFGGALDHPILAGRPGALDSRPPETASGEGTPAGKPPPAAPPTPLRPRWDATLNAYRLADSAGDVWTDPDPRWLAEFVRLRDAGDPWAAKFPRKKVGGRNEQAEATRPQGR